MNEIDPAFIIDVEEIDTEDYTSKPASWFVGKYLRWHDEELLPFVVINRGLYAKMEIVCQYCHKATCDVFVSSGLHTGAWCYAHNEDGKYIANLRDQSYVCSPCAKEREVIDAKKVKRLRRSIKRLASQLYDAMHNLEYTKKFGAAERPVTKACFGALEAVGSYLRRKPLTKAQVAVIEALTRIGSSYDAQPILLHFKQGKFIYNYALPVDADQSGVASGHFFRCDAIMLNPKHYEDYTITSDGKLVDSTGILRAFYEGKINVDSH